MVGFHFHPPAILGVLCDSCRNRINHHSLHENKKELFTEAKKWCREPTDGRTKVLIIDSFLVLQGFLKTCGKDIINDVRVFIYDHYNMCGRFHIPCVDITTRGDNTVFPVKITDNFSSANWINWIESLDKGIKEFDLESRSLTGPGAANLDPSNLDPDSLKININGQLSLGEEEAQKIAEALKDVRSPDFKKEMEETIKQTKENPKESPMAVSFNPGQGPVNPAPATNQPPAMPSFIPQAPAQPTANGTPAFPSFTPPTPPAQPENNQPPVMPSFPSTNSTQAPVPPAPNRPTPTGPAMPSFTPQAPIQATAPQAPEQPVQSTVAQDGPPTFAPATTTIPTPQNLAGQSAKEILPDNQKPVAGEAEFSLNLNTLPGAEKLQILEKAFDVLTKELQNVTGELKKLREVLQKDISSEPEKAPKKTKAQATPTQAAQTVPNPAPAPAQPTPMPAPAPNPQANAPMAPQFPSKPAAPSFETLPVLLGKLISGLEYEAQMEFASTLAYYIIGAIVEKDYRKIEKKHNLPSDNIAYDLAVSDFGSRIWSAYQLIQGGVDPNLVMQKVNPRKEDFDLVLQLVPWNTVQKFAVPIDMDKERQKYGL